MSLNFKRNIYLIISQTFQRYEVRTVFRLLRAQTIRGFPKLFIRLCTRPSHSSGVPQTTAPLGAMRKESPPPAAHRLNEGPTVSESEPEAGAAALGVPRPGAKQVVTC